jgi:alcohol dehydrogenase
MISIEESQRVGVPLPEQAITDFDFQPRTRLIFGAGSAERLGELARDMGGARALLVTDPGIVAAGHVARACASLTRAGIEVTVFDQVRENPTTRDVDACLEVAREAEIDLIIGLGGGSSMDTAKGCNFLLTNGGRMQDYWGVGKATRPMLPLIAVPTTAGTGSECQSYALIADETTHQKMACGDPKAAPRVALLDPELTVSQPQHVTACTGIDALAHALEAAVTRRRNALSVMLAREAFRLTFGHLERVLEAPDDLQARAQMQLGAALAGMAIEQSMLGAAHAAANPLTARFDVVHGRAVGVMLPHVIAFNAADPAARATYVELANLAGVGVDHRSWEIDNGPAADGRRPAAEESVAALTARVSDLLQVARIPASLPDHGVPASAIPELAVEAAAQWTAGHNPRSVTAPEFEVLYQAAMCG